MTLTVVTGPPCVGKSWHVRHHARPGDVVIDLDRIALALTTEGTGHHDYPDHVRLLARKARYAALRHALPLSRQHDVWVIDADPSPESLRWYRQHQANIVTLSETPEVLARRLLDRPERNQALVRGLPAPGGGGRTPRRRAVHPPT